MGFFQLWRFGVALSVALAGVGPVAHAAEPVPRLRVLLYDSLMASSGLGPVLLEQFKKKCACEVQALPSGDGGQVLARLALDAERSKPSAQVVVGLDQNLWPRAQAWVEPLTLETQKKLKKVRWEAPVRQVLARGEGKASAVSAHWVPYDYGAFAWMIDQEQLAERKLKTPQSLQDFLSPSYRKMLLLQDPRTSTPGLSFLLLTWNTLGEKSVWDYWAKLSPQWLTLSPGWDSAYGLFLEKQAPLVWSYVTSQAYHAENGDTKGRYAAWIPPEGTVAQVEGAALIRGSFESPAQKKLAEEFLLFLISPEIQKQVPLKNWMLPARAKVPLPESFRKLPKPKKILLTEEAAVEKLEKLLESWSRAIRGERP